MVCSVPVIIMTNWVRLACWRRPIHTWIPQTLQRFSFNRCRTPAACCLVWSSSYPCDKVRPSGSFQCPRHSLTPTPLCADSACKQKVWTQSNTAESSSSLKRLTTHISIYSRRLSSSNIQQERLFSSSPIQMNEDQESRYWAYESCCSVFVIVCDQYGHAWDIGSASWCSDVVMAEHIQSSWSHLKAQCSLNNTSIFIYIATFLKPAHSTDTWVYPQKSTMTTLLLSICI